MAGIVNDENIVKNGISSVLSSPDSVDVLIHHDASETSPSDLPSASGCYRPISNSTTRSSQSSTSEITWDFSTTPVNSSESTASSDFSGTRFIVKRMQSSELHQQTTTNSSSTNSSSSRVDRTPSQSPKSVKFSVERESPVKSPRKSPKGNTSKEKSPRNSGLTKSITTDEIPKLLDPKELFSPISQDSFSSKEEIELPPLSGNKRGEETSDEEIFLKSDRSKAPLLSRKNATPLSDSETSLLNRAQGRLSLDVGPEERVTAVSVTELTTTPVSTTSPSVGTSTANANSNANDPKCQKCVYLFTIVYITFLVGLFIGGGIMYWSFHYFDHLENNNLDNRTDSDIATALSAGILNLGASLKYVSPSADEPLSTELPTTTDEFTTMQETDNPMLITNAPNNVDLSNTATHN